MKTKSRLKLMLILAFFSFFITACEQDEVFQELRSAPTKESVQLTPTNKFYTGFAFGENSFIDFGLSDTQWGWISKFENQKDTLYFPLFIRTENYDGGDGANIGELRLFCNSGDFVAEYYTRKGWAMMETNLYASTKKPISCDPASFTAHHQLFRKTTDQHLISVKKLPVYVIGHATVIRTQ